MALPAGLGVLLLLLLGGCGSGTDAATEKASAGTSQSASHTAGGHPKGIEVSLKGPHGLSGHLVMPGFPYGDEIQINAKHLGRARGDRAYVLWGVHGNTMIPLGLWPSEADGDLRVHDDILVAKLLILLQEGPTRLMISRANANRVLRATQETLSLQRPSYVGDEILEGALAGPGLQAAAES